MELRWHGHSFFSLVTADGTRVLIDPYVENGQTRKRVEDFSPQLILITHAHDDHVGSALEWSAPILSTWEISQVLAKRARGEVVGMGVGGFVKRGSLRVWCAPAVHSSSFEPDSPAVAASNSEFPVQGGAPCGFVIDDGETRFYHAGDTAIFGDMRTVIRDLLQPHVAAVPIGDFFTMGPEHAARAVEWLGVSTAVPMHYNTAARIRQDPHHFEKLVGHHARVVIPPVDSGFVQHGARFGGLLA